MRSELFPVGPQIITLLYCRVSVQGEKKVMMIVMINTCRVSNVLLVQKLLESV